MTKTMIMLDFFFLSVRFSTLRSSSVHAIYHVVLPVWQLPPLLSLFCRLAVMSSCMFDLSCVEVSSLD